MKTQPKITESNMYKEPEMIRVVIQFIRLVPFPVAPEYMWACYECFYPWFKYREQAEDAFEELIKTSVDMNVPLGHSIAATVGMIDSFKEKRNFQ